MYQSTINLFIVFIVLGRYPVNTVFVSRKTYFKFENGKRFVNTVNIISNEIVSSKGVCTTKCTMEQDCCVASFDSANGMCRLTQNCRPEVELSISSLVIRRNSGECRRSNVGYAYLGRVNVTPTYRQCQRWNATYPVNIPVHLDLTHHSTINLEDNYCRNPDVSRGGPWCYTVDPNVAWEYCEIQFCEGQPRECLESLRGIEYFGHVSQSQSGIACARWDAQSSPTQDVFYLEDQENYCRNPYGLRQKPWCYVNGPIAWEYCDIPLC